MSKDLFFLMRTQEFETANFLPTKKELVKHSTQFAHDLMASGDHNAVELLAQAKRMQESINAIYEVLKDKIPHENFEAFGVTGQFRNGGELLNYKDCEIWQDIATELKERESLLKLAYKSNDEIYDSAGVMVPKVSANNRKDSLVLTF